MTDPKAAAERLADERCRRNPIETFVNEKLGREFSWGSCPLCKTVVTVSATVLGVKRNLRRHMKAKHPKEDIRLQTVKGPCPCRVCRTRRKADAHSSSARDVLEGRAKPKAGPEPKGE